MALKNYKPTTPSQRGLVLVDRSELWSGKPVKAYSQGGALYHEAVGIYDDTIRLIRTHEMGAGVAKVLGRAFASMKDLQAVSEAQVPRYFDRSIGG